MVRYIFCRRIINNSFPWMKVEYSTKCRLVQVAIQKKHELTYVDTSAAKSKSERGLVRSFSDGNLNKSKLKVNSCSVTVFCLLRNSCLQVTFCLCSPFKVANGDV